MIPAAIQLLGHTWAVVLHDGYAIAPDGDECKGYCDFERQEIHLNATMPESLLWHTFFHELTHAVLYYMGTKLCANEAFVDMVAGLYSQALKPLREKGHAPARVVRSAPAKPSHPDGSTPQSAPQPQPASQRSERAAKSRKRTEARPR
jgi:hypothetical protein